MYISNTYPGVSPEYPEGNPYLQMDKWGEQGLADQIQEGDKQDKKIQQQTEATYNIS